MYYPGLGHLDLNWGTAWPPQPPMKLRLENRCGFGQKSYYYSLGSNSSKCIYSSPGVVIHILLEHIVKLIAIWVISVQNVSLLSSLKTYSKIQSKTYSKIQSKDIYSLCLPLLFLSSWNLVYYIPTIWICFFKSAVYFLSFCSFCFLKDYFLSAWFIFLDSHLIYFLSVYIPRSVQINYRLIPRIGVRPRNPDSTPL